MAKQAQPKVSELVEILIQQQLKSDKINKQISNALVVLTDIIKNTQLRVNVSELRSIEKASSETRQSEFDAFHREIKINNKELLQVQKIVSSKRLLYIIVLNIFLLSAAGLSVYIAIKKSIEKSEFELLVEEQKELKHQINDVKTFFSENPKTYIHYKEWIKD